MSYISPSDVAVFTNTTLEANGTAFLTAVIPALEAAIESAANRTWSITAGQTETFDGGVTRLFPKHTPISEVTSLTVNGNPLTQNTDFYVMPSYIRLAYTVTSGIQNVVLTYTPAETVPADVKLALTRWAALLITQENNSATDAAGPVQKIEMGPMSVQYATRQLINDPLPDFVAEVVARYRRFV